QWLFWIVLILVLAAAAMLPLVPESPIRTPGRIDVPGALLLLGWLLPLLLGISKAASWGWGSPRVLGLFGLSLIVLAVWVVVEKRRENPLIAIEMLRSRAVWTTNGASVGC